MKLRNLSEDETEIVYQCLKCVAGGKFILHDWEFQTIMGLDVDEFLGVYNSWPNIDEDLGEVQLAINNSINNLLGYPHGKHHKMEEFIGASLEKISEVFQKWRGEKISSYFEGME